MIERLQSFLVRSRWARVYRRGGDYTWLHEPAVRRYANAGITGDPDVWPMDWFRDRFAGRTFRRALSLGCGEGLLDRDVAGKGICTSILGIDLLDSALERARELARQAGLDGIEYRRADMNRLRLGDESFEVVFSHQALHHVADLEGCVAEIARTLEPGGVLYLDEYVGPSRGEWRQPLLAAAEEVYASLPGSLRQRRRLRFPIDRSDPSEAVRSSEIVAALENHFAIVERRDYGGNLLAVIHPHLRWEKLSQPEGLRAVDELIAAERRLLADGVPSFYAVLIAEPVTRE
jgi:SAM-dependent methyltransferase